MNDKTQQNEPVLPALPLRDTLLYPNLTLPISASRQKSVAAIEAVLATEDKLIGFFTQRDATKEEIIADDLYQIGTVGVVKKMQRRDKTIHMLVQGTQRIERIGVALEDPYLNFRVRYLKEQNDSSSQVEAQHRTMLELANQMLALRSSQVQIDLEALTSTIELPTHQAYVLASLLSIDVAKHQALLEAKTNHDALTLVIDYLSHEVQVLQIQEQIATAAQSNMDKQQREFMLRQQLRAIQDELGESSPEQDDVAELRRQMDEVDLPELVKKEIHKEMARLERMSASAPDYQVTRTYVELILDLPWKKTTEDIFDLDRAQQVLDEDHFDLEDIKERIIEHLAVMKLNPHAKAPIICFVGPPGVGKTSLGQSVARALGRKFERMSLGGLHDEAELRGHRRTYIGAMPGRIIRAIRRAGVKNPLLMLDEVDKLGRDFRGDPAAALMEILDPAQNKEFNDNYLDLPFDLSSVFFIVTANTLETIPTPLLDRLEIIRLTGYSDEEKRQIAKRYLIGRQLHETGLTHEQLAIPDDTLDVLIHLYTRESGVRQLERTLGQLARKIAMRVVTGKTSYVTVKPDEVADLLGPAKYFREDTRNLLPPGVVPGLAWTPVGGEVLYVEAVLMPDGKGLTLTGQLGDVMQESAKAAQSYLWAHSNELSVDQDKIRKSGVHIHVPSGATPKDGPSAGVTMFTALASVYTGRAARNDIVMTGEITLSGLVLPVGGIKEKVLAAHRAAMKTVILPKNNEKDLHDLPTHVRDSLNFVFVEKVEQVLQHALVAINGYKEVSYA